MGVQERLGCQKIFFPPLLSTDFQLYRTLVHFVPKRELSNQPSNKYISWLERRSNWQFDTKVRRIFKLYLVMTSPHKASSSYPPIYGDGSSSPAPDGGGEEEQDEFGSGAAANGGKGR